MKNKSTEQEQKQELQKTDVSSSDLLKVDTGNKFMLPLEMTWQPKEDITTYELAKCLPYLIRCNPIMPYEIDKTEIHFRHFDIIEHNSEPVAYYVSGIKEDGKINWTKRTI